MQLQAGEHVLEHQLHSLGHVTAAGMGLERVVAEVRALEATPENLAEGEDAGDRIIL
jgi:hypothetical protein